MKFGKRTPVNNTAIQDALALQAALNKAQAVIWFAPDGTILDANENFLATLGYQLEEIKGQHHRMFVYESYAKSSEYSAFWENLASGSASAGEFKRIAKDGRGVWIEASYNPVFDDAGNLVKVVKFAIDITEAKKKSVDEAGKIAAISNTQAVIEFQLDGTIITANQNFLATLGYTLAEITGQHHRMFVENGYANTSEYRQFWEALANGEFQSGEYMRLAKDGSEVWINATYTPIKNADGKPTKVVKFATDITKNKMKAADSNGQLAAISKAQAVIEFDLKGTVLKANDNFLSTLGYELSEISGKHHSMFVDPAEVSKPEYTSFWKDLREGKFQSGQYRRRSKSGEDIWIQASYSPIFDLNGKPYKVVKYATDVTNTKRAMEALVEGLNSLSTGDLSARLPETLTGEFSSIRDTFNNTLLRLEDLASGILSSSESIAEETNSIAQNASDLSTRGERQAATVEETSAAMEEISVTVTSTVENARTATQAAEVASEHAQQGGTIVTNAVEAMARIETSTQEISKIVEVIDAIAFQTNLLALNAGVEAARAGDAGRGFAVVASEVRALAHRSSESAREINDLITKSNKEVSEGSALVNKSGQALTKIVSGVTAVVENINEILNASQEQATGITEVTQAVSEIDRTTQHTAGLADESATAANQLAERAANLRELVSFFGHGAKTGTSTANIAEAKPILAGNSTPVVPAQKAVGAQPAHTNQPAISSADTEGWEEF